MPSAWSTADEVEVVLTFGMGTAAAVREKVEGMERESTRGTSHSLLQSSWHRLSDELSAAEDLGRCQSTTHLRWLSLCFLLGHWSFAPLENSPTAAAVARVLGHGRTGAERNAGESHSLFHILIAANDYESVRYLLSIVSLTWRELLRGGLATCHRSLSSLSTTQSEDISTSHREGNTNNGERDERLQRHLEGVPISLLELRTGWNGSGPTILRVLYSTAGLRKAQELKTLLSTFYSFYADCHSEESAGTQAEDRKPGSDECLTERQGSDESVASIASPGPHKKEKKAKKKRKDSKSKRTPRESATMPWFPPFTSDDSLVIVVRLVKTLVARSRPGEQSYLELLLEFCCCYIGEKESPRDKSAVIFNDRIRELLTMQLGESTRLQETDKALKKKKKKGRSRRGTLQWPSISGQLVRASLDSHARVDSWTRAVLVGIMPENKETFLDKVIAPVLKERKGVVIFKQIHISASSCNLRKIILVIERENQGKMTRKGLVLWHFAGYRGGDSQYFEFCDEGLLVLRNPKNVALLLANCMKHRQGVKISLAIIREYSPRSSVIILASKAYDGPSNGNAGEVAIAALEAYTREAIEDSEKAGHHGVDLNVLWKDSEQCLHVVDVGDDDGVVQRLIDLPAMFETIGMEGEALLAKVICRDVALKPKSYHWTSVGVRVASPDSTKPGVIHWDVLAGTLRRFGLTTKSAQVAFAKALHDMTEIVWLYDSDDWYLRQWVVLNPCCLPNLCAALAKRARSPDPISTASTFSAYGAELGSEAVSHAFASMSLPPASIPFVLYLLQHYQSIMVCPKPVPIQTSSDSTGRVADYAAKPADGEASNLKEVVETASSGPHENSFLDWQCVYKSSARPFSFENPRVLLPVSEPLADAYFHGSVSWRKFNLPVNTFELRTVIKSKVMQLSQGNPRLRILNHRRELIEVELLDPFSSLVDKSNVFHSGDSTGSASEFSSFPSGTETTDLTADSTTDLTASTESTPRGDYSVDPTDDDESTTETQAGPLPKPEPLHSYPSAATAPSGSSNHSRGGSDALENSTRKDSKKDHFAQHGALTGTTLGRIRFGMPSSVFEVAILVVGDEVPEFLSILGCVVSSAFESLFPQFFLASTKEMAGMAGVSVPHNRDQCESLDIYDVVTDPGKREIFERLLLDLTLPSPDDGIVPEHIDLVDHSKESSVWTVKTVQLSRPLEGQLWISSRSALLPECWVAHTSHCSLVMKSLNLTEDNIGLLWGATQHMRLLMEKTHLHIVPPLAVFSYPTPTLLSPLATHGTVSSFLAASQRISDVEFLRCIEGLLTGVMYLHEECHLYHLQLFDASNVLVFPCNQSDSLTKATVRWCWTGFSKSKTAGSMTAEERVIAHSSDMYGIGKLLQTLVQHAGVSENLVTRMQQVCEVVRERSEMISARSVISMIRAVTESNIPVLVWTTALIDMNVVNAVMVSTDAKLALAKELATALQINPLPCASLTKCERQESLEFFLRIGERFVESDNVLALNELVLMTDDMTSSTRTFLLTSFLERAVYCSSVLTVRRLLYLGIDVDTALPLGETVLQMSLLSPSWKTSPGTSRDTLLSILKWKPDMGLGSVTDPRLPLEIAILNSNSVAVRILLEHGCDPNQRTSDGQSLLSKSLSLPSTGKREGGKFDLVTLILLNGAVNPGDLSSQELTYSYRAVHEMFLSWLRASGSVPIAGCSSLAAHPASSQNLMNLSQFFLTSFSEQSSDLTRVNKVLFKIMSMRATKTVKLDLNCQSFHFSDHSLSEVWSFTLHNLGRVPLNVKITALPPSDIMWEANTAMSHTLSYDGDPQLQQRAVLGDSSCEELSPLEVSPSDVMLSKDTMSTVSVRLQRHKKGPYTAAVQLTIGDDKLGYMYMFVTFRTAVKGMVPCLRQHATSSVAVEVDPMLDFASEDCIAVKESQHSLSLANSLRSASSLSVQAALARGEDSDGLVHEEDVGWVSPLHLAALSGSVTCMEMLTGSGASYVACPPSTPLPVSLDPRGRRNLLDKNRTADNSEVSSSKDLSSTLTVSVSLSLGHSWSSLGSGGKLACEDSTAAKKEVQENLAIRALLNDHRTRGLSPSQVAQFFAVIEKSGERGRELALSSSYPTALEPREPLGIGARPGSTALAVRRLYLRACEIDVLPGSVGVLSNMEDLYLRLCPVRLLPATLANCSSLKCLGIDDFRSLDHLPYSINSLSGIQAYLAAIANQSPVNIARGKVVVVGKEKSGKTCLVARLCDKWRPMDKVASKLSRFRNVTEGVDISEWPPKTVRKEFEEGDNISFSLWDFAGQQLYYVTHELFLSEGMIYFLVFSLLDDDGQQRLLYWLNTIAMRGYCSQVLCIGTFADKLSAGEVQQVSCRLEEQISIWQARCGESVSGIRLVRHSPSQLIWPVSNTQNKGTRDVIKELFTLARQHLVTVPASYQNVLRAIQLMRTEFLQHNDPPLCSLKKLTGVMLGQGVKEVEISTCVKSLSEWGAIQYYPAIASLQDLVILDPHWTSDFFKSLISHKRSQALTQEGIVIVSDMEEQWANSGIDKKWFPSLWALLTEFELLVRIQGGRALGTAADLPGRRIRQKARARAVPVRLNRELVESGSEVYLMPACVGVKKKKEVNSTTGAAAELGRQYVFDFVPPGLYNSVLVRVLEETLLWFSALQESHLATRECALDVHLWENGIVLSLVETSTPPGEPHMSEALATKAQSLFKSGALITSPRGLVKSSSFTATVPEGGKGRERSSRRRRLLALLVDEAKELMSVSLELFPTNRESLSAGVSRLFSHTLEVWVTMSKHCRESLSLLQTQVGEGVSERDETTVDSLARNLFALVHTMVDTRIRDKYPALHMHHTTVACLHRCRSKEDSLPPECDAVVASVPRVHAMRQYLLSGKRELSLPLPEEFSSSLTVAAADLIPELLDPTAAFAHTHIAPNLLGNVAEVTLVRPLAEGNSGQVWLARIDGKPVAWKKYHNDCIDDTLLDDYFTEITMLGVIDHPNIVKLIRFYTSPSLSFAMELLPLGNLLEVLGQLVADGNSLRLETSLRIAIELASAISYLHSLHPPVYHNDVKLSNIMVVSNLLDENSSTLVKLADFGYATFTTTASNSLDQDVAMFKDTVSVLLGAPYTEHPTLDDTTAVVEPSELHEQARQTTLAWGHEALQSVIAAPTHPQGMTGVKEDLLIMWRALRSKKIDVSA